MLITFINCLSGFSLTPFLVYILKCSLVIRTSTPKFLLALLPNKAGHSRKYNLALYFIDLPVRHWMKIYACPDWNFTCLGLPDKWCFYSWYIKCCQPNSVQFSEVFAKEHSNRAGGARRVWEGEIPIHGKKLFEKYNVHVVGMKQLLLKPRDQLLRTQNRELWRRMLNVNETTHLFEYIGLYFYTNEKERWIFREIFEIIWESGGSND